MYDNDIQFGIVVYFNYITDEWTRSYLSRIKIIKYLENISFFHDSQTYWFRQFFN